MREKRGGNKQNEGGSNSADGTGTWYGMLDIIII